MARIFNIAGPCSADRHYMLPALDRLPNVRRLIDDEAYFVIHAPRQCGKTTAIQALADEINAKGTRVALYCSLEEAQGLSDSDKGLACIVDQIRAATDAEPDLFGNVTKGELRTAVADADDTSKVKATLKVLAEHCGKPLVVFFDEVDCLSEGTLIGFLRQLRSGRITYRSPGTFPMYAEIIGRYLSWGTQQAVRQKVPETPWVKDGSLDMAGIMDAFQRFWRENADEASVPFHYRKSYPQLVLQAFLQRVLNGGGEIIREMALGKKALDIGVVFHGSRYAIECKKVDFFYWSPESAYEQVLGYMDRLGVDEGWLVVFDPDLSKPWEEKIGQDEVLWKGKRIHVVRC